MSDTTNSGQFVTNPFQKQVQDLVDKTKLIVDGVDNKMITVNDGSLQITDMWTDFINKMRYQGEVKYVRNTSGGDSESTHVFNDTGK